MAGAAGGAVAPHEDDSDEWDEYTVSAYTFAVALAQCVLDSPGKLRLWSGRHQQGVRLRLCQRRLMFEDASELVTAIKESRAGCIHQWLASQDAAPILNMDTDTWQDHLDDTIRMLQPMLQLEILQRREAAFFDAKFDAAGHTVMDMSHAKDGARLELVDVSEDASEPPNLLTVPVELAARILQRCKLSGATAFGLASKRSSARLFQVLRQAADRKAKAADKWIDAGSCIATRLEGCRWERWGMIEGPFGAYGGRYDAIEWDGLNRLAPHITHEPVVAMQLRRAFASALLRAISAASVHGPRPEAALALVSRWAYALRASSPVCPDGPTILPRVWHQDWGLSAAAVGKLARTWRRQHRWTSQQLASLANWAVWGEDGAPHMRLPPAPPTTYAEEVCLTGPTGHSWEALGQVPDAGVALQGAAAAGDFRALTLESSLLHEILRSLPNPTEGRQDSIGLAAAWLRGFGGLGLQEEVRWLCARLLRSTQEPASIDPPLHRDVLRLRVRAERLWRDRWRRYVDQLSASAAVGFHRILRVSCVSDEPEYRKAEDPYSLSVSLSVVFGRVSVLIDVHMHDAPDAHTHPRSASVQALSQLVDGHLYQTPMIADFGPRARQVALLHAHLASDSAPTSSVGRAQFLLTLCCARLGDPASGLTFATRGGPMRIFTNVAHLTQFGELMADLALPVTDMAAIFAAFGSSDGHTSDGDFGATDPTPAFEAWAKRVDFPAAWGGMEAWRHFPSLTQRRRCDRLD